MERFINKPGFYCQPVYLQLKTISMGKIHGFLFRCRFSQKTDAVWP